MIFHDLILFLKATCFFLCFKLLKKVTHKMSRCYSLQVPSQFMITNQENVVQNGEGLGTSKIKFIFRIFEYKNSISIRIFLYEKYIISFRQIQQMSVLRNNMGMTSIVCCRTCSARRRQNTSVIFRCVPLSQFCHGALYRVENFSSGKLFRIGAGMKAKDGRIWAHVQ